MPEETTTKKNPGVELQTTDGGLLPLLARTAADAVQRPFYTLYERYLEATAHLWRKPQHIGIIMDGNRRFARMLRASDVAYGHLKGADKLREMLDWCFEHEIPVVTVWGFSLDNFQRNSAEVKSLLELFEIKTLEMVDSPDLHDNHVRVRFIGRIDMLPESLQTAIHKVEQATGHYERFILNIALAYGGREEIADAFRDYLTHMAETGRNLEQAAEQFDPKVLERYLYTSGLPEPDLIVRTSGEVRLSGFMMWQSANSEFYFCDTNWPAFRKIDFLRALRSYDQRQRRFGR
ncbi:MAG: polyprenyl diphosphate synthase [Myxococcales bacterium]|nr:polyprenyl diphosphate synthase [Myxococcales bacterium]MDD9966992.1 polyprenyl diphosphate synthase [Myxococcales bacterium]